DQGTARREHRLRRGGARLSDPRQTRASPRRELSPRRLHMNSVPIPPPCALVGRGLRVSTLGICDSRASTPALPFPDRAGKVSLGAILRIRSPPRLGSSADQSSH